MTLALLQYTLTHRLQATDSLPPSLFIQSLISFHQLCLFPLFSSSPFYSAGYSCLCQIQSLLPSWPLLLSLLTSLSSFHYLPSCLLSPPLLLSLSLLTISFICLLFSISTVSSSLLALSLSSILLLALQRSPLLALFFCLSPPLRPLTLYFPLAFSLCALLFSQPFSPSLWVPGLCGDSQPPVGHPAGERAEKQTV